jgi:hypothetical protein
VLTAAVVQESLRQEVLAAAIPRRVAAIYEFWVPRSNERADVVVIDSRMDGFEIKTERDTLKRLPRQAAAYARLFDRCHVVLAERHVEDALEILPRWWGVMAIRVGDSPGFEKVREADVNYGVDPETLVRLLWRTEVHAALCMLGAPPDSGAGRFQMWQQLLGLIDLDALKLTVREALIRRDPASARIPSQRFSLR